MILLLKLCKPMKSFYNIYLKDNYMKADEPTNI